MTTRGYPVVVQNVDCVLATKGQADITSTPVQVTFSGGAVAVRYRYVDLGSADGTRGYIVFDAVDSAAATAALLSNDSRQWFFLGGDWSDWVEFAEESPSASCWVKSDTAAETGDSMLLFEYKVPV